MKEVRGPKPEAQNRLLVEGKDDKWSVINLMARHGIDWASGNSAIPFVYPCEDVQNVLDTIPVAAKTYKRLGIVIDANTSFSQRWIQIQQRLEPLGITVPDQPASKGTTFAGMDSKRKIGVWLMPNNVDKGCLEDFLATLVPAGDPCWAYAQESAGEAKKRGARFPEVDRQKAEIHTWLAWQERPGVPFGTAITAAFFRTDSDEAMAFANWFRNLFLI